MNTGVTLVISVGGSPEPVVASIREHRPVRVVFFCSQDTVETVGPIREQLGRHGVTVQEHKVLVEDPQDLVHCYERALLCADLALADGGSPSAVLVDFTGGTKAMTAALVLATIGRGFGFSYVGGTARTKNGRGVVESGAETIIRRGDPFLLFAVEERKRLAGFFRTYQFKAARAVVEGLLARPLSEPDRVAFQMVRDLAQGYELWERFDYLRALEVLGRCARTWALAVRANPSIRYATVLPVLETNVRWLQRIAQRTAGFTRPDAALIPDLLANAERRAQEGSYDDATVRLYRALELGAQAAIQRRLGCGTDAVPVDMVPESLREEFVPRYERRPGCLELPLQAAYRLLEALGEPEGRRYAVRAGEFRKIQAARNHSWLAHGMVPCDQAGFESLARLVADSLEVQDRVQFPTLDE
ncbi:TIGR02710 family CRISPR-associated CARF protein [Nitrospira sp. Kam-Ns4a]